MVRHLNRALLWIIHELFHIIFNFQVGTTLPGARGILDSVIHRRTFLNCREIKAFAECRYIYPNHGLHP